VTGFQEQYGPWAFIAGASMGIGAAFSHEAAARGLNVLMLARGQEQLDRMAEEVRAGHGVEVRTLAADLAADDIGTVVADATDDLEVGLFVYNAAVAPVGRFIDTPLDAQLLSVAVNCATPTILCNLLAPKMAARGRGGIGMVSSMGGMQGAVNFGTYNAGKAYEWILAETLWAELGDAGVHVTNCFVGATSSPNYNSYQETLDPELCGRPDTDDPLDRARSRLMDPNTPEEVASALYDQLADGPVCFAHRDDAWVAEVCLALPRAEAVGVWRALQETSTRTPDRQAR
jgi:short-subunit dehydrogenase